MSNYDPESYGPFPEFAEAPAKPDPAPCPDYKRVRRALQLAEAEYVGQSWEVLWEWAWNEAGNT